MKIMVDLDRTVFDCPSFTYFFGNMSFGESNLHKELKYVAVDSEKSDEYNIKYYLNVNRERSYRWISNNQLPKNHGTKDIYKVFFRSYQTAATAQDTLYPLCR